MENSTSEKLHTSAQNADNSLNSGKGEITYNRSSIEGTPFTVVWDKDKGFSAGIANTKMTPWYQTEEELLEKIKGIKEGRIDWNLMTDFVTTIIVQLDQMKKQNELVEALADQKQYIDELLNENKN